MEAQVEGLPAIGNGPFDGDWTVRLAHDGAQQKRSIDIIVVRHRDDRLQAESLNLRLLQIKGEFGRHGWRPVAPAVIDPHAVIVLGTRLKPMHERAHERVAAAEHSKKLERLSRLIGMTVERDPRPEALTCSCISPEIKNRGVFHCPFPLPVLRRLDVIVRRKMQQLSLFTTLGETKSELDTKPGTRKEKEEFDIGRTRGTKGVIFHQRWPTEKLTESPPFMSLDANSSMGETSSKK